MVFDNDLFQNSKIRSKQVGGISKQSIDKDKLPEKYGPFYFDQPIDHFSSNQTTFKHRYWANTDAYKPGGPVIRKFFFKSHK